MDWLWSYLCLNWFSLKPLDAQGLSHWLTGIPLYVMLGLVLLTMVIIWGLPKLTKAFPSSLAAILVISAIVIGFNIDTRTVGDIASIKGGFPPFHIANVLFGTFEWSSIRMIGRMPRHDIFVGILVAVITVLLHNLALAVVVGVIISALVFAWESAKKIRTKEVR